MDGGKLFDFERVSPKSNSTSLHHKVEYCHKGTECQSNGPIIEGQTNRKTNRLMHKVMIIIS